MNHFRIQQTNKGIEYSYSHTIRLIRTHIGIRNEDMEYFQFPISMVDGDIFADLGEYGTYRESISSENSITIGTIRLKITSNKAFILYSPFEMEKPHTHPYFQIPGFLYGSNNKEGSDGNQPKFDYGGPIDWPTSSKFYTRADRSTHNCVITVSNNAVFAIGVQEFIPGITFNRSDDWMPEYAYNGLLLDSSHPHKDILGFSLGYEHFPQRYSWVWNDPITPNNDEYKLGWIRNQHGKTVYTKSYYFCDNADGGIPDYGKALQAFYKQLHEPPLKRASREDAMRFCINAITEHGWVKDEKYFFLSDNSDEGRGRGSTAWTGGMQVAYPILAAGIKLNEQNYCAIAEMYINNLVHNGFNRNAQLLFEELRDGIWRVDGWWGQREDAYNWGDKPLHSAYINGQASYYILKSYVATQQKHASWLHTAEKIIHTAVRQQLENGCLGRFFDPNTGNAVDYKGFQACWFVPGLIILSQIQNTSHLLVNAEKALDYYFSFHKKGELYGTPMDTHEAVDQEGNLAFIIACVEMHKVTKNQKFIDYACIALDYEFSWKFPYNTVFSNEPLKSMNWSSCGGSVTSTHNPHIHPMGNLVAGEMYYIYTQTQNEYIAQRLKDTCIWGLGTFNTCDKDFGFGKKGYETEQFFHSDALILPWWKKWDGGIWEAYLPWASGCIILNAAENIPDSFFEP